VALIVVVSALVLLGGANWWLHRNGSPSPLSSTTPDTTADEPSENTSAPDQPVHLKLYFVALEDNGTTGTKLGCGDSLIETDVEADKTPDKLKETFVHLLSNHNQTYGSSGLYNALYQSHLTYESGSASGGVVTVKLSGTIKQGGECDAPRISAQLERAAMSATGAKRVNVYVNGKTLSKVLSNK